MSNITNLNYCKVTLELKQNIESSFLSLGERLMKIREQHLYETQWSSFGEYVMEMKISEGTASKLINIYNRFIIEYGFSPQMLLQAGGWGVVAEILPVVHNREEAKEWLEKLAVLSREDIRKEIQEKKRGVTQIDCAHSNYYTIKVCRDCGEKQTIYEDQNN